MDLFHAITQEIESVLSCHWLSEFRDSHRSSSKSSSGSATSSASNSRSSSRSPSSSPSLTSSGSSQQRSDRTSRAVLHRSNSSFTELAKTKAKSDDMAQQQPTTMMDTEPGGEQTQYEGYKGLNDPHAKQSGQLGGGLPNTTEPQGGVDEERAQKTTENIRYGQNISESGVGGFTNTVEGTANQEGGYGGTEAQSEVEQGKNSRTAQGYSAKEGVHDHNVGG